MLKSLDSTNPGFSCWNHFSVDALIHPPVNSLTMTHEVASPPLADSLAQSFNACEKLVRHRELGTSARKNISLLMNSNFGCVSTQLKVCLVGQHTGLTAERRRLLHSWMAARPLIRRACCTTFQPSTQRGELGIESSCAPKLALKALKFVAGSLHS